MNTSRALNSVWRALAQTIIGTVPLLALVFAFAGPHFYEMSWLPLIVLGVILLLAYTVSDARKLYDEHADRQPIFRPQTRYRQIALMSTFFLTALWLAAKYNGVYETEWLKVLLIWASVAIVYGFWFKK